MEQRSRGATHVQPSDTLEGYRSHNIERYQEIPMAPRSSGLKCRGRVYPLPLSLGNKPDEDKPLTCPEDYPSAA